MDTKKALKLITPTAYARLRGIDQKSMRGMLAKVGLVGKVDPVQADKLIAQSKRIRYKPGLTAKGALTSLGEAQRRETLARAKIQELKLAKIEGTLVEKAGVEKKLFELNRRGRDAMLSIPPRVSGIIAAMTDQDAVFRLLTKEIQEAMQKLAS